MTTPHVARANLRAETRSRIALALAATLLACAEARTSATGVPEWSSELVWRVDGTEGAGTPFADVRDFVVDSSGGLWVLDFAEQRIRRFDADGGPLPDAGRRGSGPGELANANGLLVAADRTVWTSDPNNGRLAVFAEDGAFLRQHVVPIGSFWLRWDAWIDRSTGLVVDPFADRATGAVASERRWRRIAPDGSIRDTLAIPSCDPPEGPTYLVYYGESVDGVRWRDYYPFTQGGGLAPDGRGGVWCATPTSRRAVRLRIGTGDTIATTGEMPLPTVTADERAAAVRDVETILRRYPTHDFDPAKIPAQKPAMVALSVDDDGRLWVEHATVLGEARMAFSVHDSTGAQIARVSLPFRSNPTGLAVRARGRDLWVALRDDDDVVSVAKFRLDTHDAARSAAPR
jgi:streptogramin lyase